MSRGVYQVASGGIANVASSTSSRGERVDVAALPGVDIALDQSRSARSPSVRRFACWLRAGTRSSTAARARCRALLTEATWCPASARSLAREAEHLAQDQHGALVGRQVLQRGDEGQLDALALLVAAPPGAARPAGSPIASSG